METYRLNKMEEPPIMVYLKNRAIKMEIIEQKKRTSSTLKRTYLQKHKKYTAQIKSGWIHFCMV